MKKTSIKAAYKFAVAMTAFIALVSMVAFAGGSKDAGGAKAADGKLTIYVVRHGQTIFNLMDRVQGISDGILTEKGIDGAVNMGKGLRDIKFDAVYTSDLKRAIETARLALAQSLATKNYTITELKELREVSFGNFEGDPNAVMYAAQAKDLGISLPEGTSMGAAVGAIIGYYKGDAKAWLEGLANFNKRIDNWGIAESADEVYARLQKGIDTVIAENPKGGNVMLVAHGQSISFLLAKLNIDIGSTQLGNSSVTKIVYDYGTKTYTLDGTVGDMSYHDAGAKL